MKYVKLALMAAAVVVVIAVAWIAIQLNRHPGVDPYRALVVPPTDGAAKAGGSGLRVVFLGVSTLLFAHVLINVGVSLGIMPATRLPLPFVSYGGSSLITCMAAVALILNVHARRFHFK